MYYQVVGDSQNSYARYVFLNEMVTGQNTEYIDNLIIREKEQPLRFDQENCYMCLLGIKKAVYADHYGLITNQYMQIYFQFEQKILDFFQKHGFNGEIFLHLYADKQIIIIYSKDQTSKLLTDQVAQYAQDCLQLLYRDHFLYDNIYCNQTYYNDKAINLQQLSIALEDLIQLSKLNFFFMEPVVFTKTLVKKLRKKTDESDIQELKQQVSTSISAGNPMEYKILFEKLMLNKLKYSFDPYLLQDTAFFLKNFYLECCSAYGIPVEKNINQFFDYTNYEKIETFTESLFLMFEKCIEFINLKGKKYSQLTQKSLRILQTSFHKEDISASYVASQVNVSPAYLSSVFNGEVEMSISQYLIKLRIEKAKKLLQETSLLIYGEKLENSMENYLPKFLQKHLPVTPLFLRSKIRIQTTTYCAQPCFLSFKPQYVIRIIISTCLEVTIKMS